MEIKHRIFCYRLLNKYPSCKYGDDRSNKFDRFAIKYKL